MRNVRFQPGHRYAGSGADGAYHTFIEISAPLLTQAIADMEDAPQPNKSWQIAGIGTLQRDADEHDLPSTLPPLHRRHQPPTARLSPAEPLTIPTTPWRTTGSPPRTGYSTA